MIFTHESINLYLAVNTVNVQKIVKLFGNYEKKSDRLDIFFEKLYTKSKC